MNVIEPIVLQGDVIDKLREMEPESVHCVVTSPPYWGLRDYGTATWEGGDPECDHKSGRFERGGLNGKQASNRGSGGDEATHICGKCGAHRIDQQIGLEATPDLFVAKMVEVFREVRRVLRSDGTCWVNMGDSYNSRLDGSHGGWNGSSPEPQRVKNDGAKVQISAPGLKPKDLVMIPARVALALQQPYEKPHLIKREVDRAWLAALVDGEGCIGIRRHDSYSNSEKRPQCQDGFISYLTIGNNDVELLQRCVEITGYGKVGIKDRPSTDSRGINSRHIYYGWRLDSEKALEVIRDIYPYLIAKRRQAILTHTLDLSNKRGRDLRGNGRLPAAEQEKRELLKALIHQCNQREPVDMPSWCEEPKREIEPGWYLRSDIIWAKPNPMPESVTDRPTKSFEHVFLLSKAATYYYDADAIKEPVKWPDGPNSPQSIKSPYGQGFTRYASGNKERLIATNGEHSRLNTHLGSSVPWESDGSGRNKRDVWTIATQSFPEAHFATFPEALVEPCLKAGTSERGVCPVCGAPWRRVVARPDAPTVAPSEIDRYGTGEAGVHRKIGGQYQKFLDANPPQTTGWVPTCTHDAEPVPAICLDPFGGSGTTGVVATRLGRKSILIELNPDYVVLARQRTAQLGMAF